MIDLSNFHVEFATKRELEIVEIKLDDLVRSNTVLTVTIESIAKENKLAIDSLAQAVSDINSTLKSLIQKKEVSDALKKLIGKCIIWSGTFMVSIITPMMVAKWSGLIKVFEKWLLS